jgi:hypothetical protein
LGSDVAGLVSIAGRCRDKGELQAAEKLLLHALTKSELRHGEMSIPVAVVLLELIELYQASGVSDLAEAASGAFYRRQAS